MCMASNRNHVSFCKLHWLLHCALQWHYAVLILIWSVVVVVVAVCCCCILLWCADAGSDLCTLCLWCFVNWRKYSTCTRAWWWSPPATFAGGAFHSATGTNTPLANMVVSPSANSVGGVLLSSYRCKYCIGTYATCTVLWWSVMVIFT